MTLQPLLFDSIWAQQWKYEAAEAHYQQVLAGTSKPAEVSGGQKQGSNKNTQGSNLKSEIAQARQNIQKALNEQGTSKPAAAVDQQVLQRIKSLETENNSLKKASQDLTNLVKKLEARVAALEKGSSGGSGAGSKPAPSAPAKEEEEDDESDFDPFGDEDESEDEETKKALEAYHAKKSKKAPVIAKSSLVIDVKPWDDETDMNELEKNVRSVEMDGLVWGASKLVPVGYGIKKLQISAVIEDEKVSTDTLEELVTAFEDHVQSMDIVAFNKI